MVRVDLPGWALTKIAADTTTTMVKEEDFYQRVLITSTPNNADGSPGTPVILYSTTDVAVFGITGVTALTDVQKDALAMVKTLSKDRVEIELESTWNNGGTLSITLGNIPAGIPSHLPEGADAAAYANYQLTASSKARNGTLKLLADQPNVRVGNILGTRIDDADADNATPDTLKRNFTIKPGVVYQGEEKRNFTIEFKAPGPMYGNDTAGGTGITITIPNGIRPANDTDITGNNVSTDRPGLTRTNVAYTASAGTIVIPFDEVKTDQTITVSYSVDVGATATTYTTNDDDAGFDAVTRIGTTPTAATNITGGLLSAKDASGDVMLDRTSAAVSTPRTFTVKYTSLTDLTDATLQITPMGIVIVDDTATTTVTEMLTTSSASYGYVRAASGDAGKGTLTVIQADPDASPAIPNTMIQWADLNLKKGQSVSTVVGPVNVMSRPGKAEWTVALANTTTTNPTATIAADGTDKIMDVDSGTAGAQTLDFYATEATGTGVAFAIADPMDYPAGSKQTIEFQFTANATPIRDGYVRVQLPSGWTRPNPTKAGDTVAKRKAAKVTTDAAAKVSISGDTLESGSATTPAPLTISGNTITAHVDSLIQGGTITITYGVGTDKDGKADSKLQAMIQNTKQDAVKIYGYAKASPDTSEVRQEISVKVTNAADGSGSATIVVHPGGDTIRAGSSDSEVHVKFTAAGTMAGGHVLLQLPAGWGNFQRDDVEPNYIEILGSGATLIEPKIGQTSNRAVAEINDRLGATGSFTFVYGGGNGGEQNGVDAQNHLGPATFTIKSDGGGDMVYADITSETKYDGTAAAQVLLQEENPHRTGQLFMNYAGQLRVLVGGAVGGSGTAVVDKAAVNAADPVTLKFTYTATQTIQNGNLKFTVPSGWSMPQTDDPSMAGYTEATGSGIGAAADDDAMSVVVPITFISSGDTIVITYGLGDNAAATTVGKNQTFTIQIEGTAGSGYEPIGRSPAVTVNPQAAGKGMAVASVTADADGSTELYAGEPSREIVVVYTAAGQMVNSQVKLTLPAVANGWSAASADHVTAMSSAGGALTPMYGADATPATQEVIVTGINLPANGTVTFVYTGSIGVKKASATFGVATTGEITATTTTPAFSGVSGNPVTGANTTVDVGYAKAGSGTASVDMPVIAPSPAEGAATAVTLTFTYTAAGETIFPKQFRVRVPTAWSATVAAADYTVAHISAATGVDTLTRTIEKLNPVVNDMVARVKNVTIASYRVQAGDQVVFTYTTTAPVTEGPYPFQVLFDGALVEGTTGVRVQGTSPTTLAVSGGTVSADAGAAPLAITVGLVDDDMMERATVSPVAVTLTSSSATGAFSADAEAAGTASLTVNIAAGGTSAMAYYSDSTAGTATITATATGLTMGTAAVTVTTDVLVITSASADAAIAKDGDTVTVTAMATAGQGSNVTVTIGTIVSAGPMAESPSGTYTRAVALATGTQEGTYDITVNLGGQTMSAGMLTVDNTAPTVTVTAPESAMNGDAVMVSATVVEAGTVASVTADVSALDSTQTAMVALTMADGAYSASHTISEDNAAENGSKTITVTATDAAGNSGTGTAMVMLDNKLSFTSMIPAGTSLFHVPLDDTAITTVGDLKTKIGDAVNLVLFWNAAESRWDSSSDDVEVTGGLGLVLNMSSAASVTFEGDSWGGTAGTATLTLVAGTNLIGLPINQSGVVNVSDIAGLFPAGVVGTVLNSGLTAVAGAQDPDDGPVAGDAGYLVTATPPGGTAALVGSGWSNGDDASAAPVALAGYSADNQTPVLDVSGTVVDELTGLAREGFRVKVKNLSTKTALSNITSDEAAGGYNMTFVDLNTAHAARVGDVLEISADSPDPLIGVQPVRHVVTVDDVKSVIIQLENLIAYEIPAETELLRNYPNPFNPETWIPYHLSEDTNVSLTIYDTNGHLVRTIDVGHQSAAKYDTRAKAIYWDGRNQFGEQVASGVYFYSLEAGDFSATRKMVILK